MISRGTFNLEPQTSDAIDEIVRDKGGDKTTAVNRAVQAFAMLARAHAVYIRETPDGELVRVMFL